MTDLIRSLPASFSIEGHQTITRTHRVALVAKRLIDMVLSAVALILIAPVILAVAIAVRLDSKGPALFRQTRVGVGGRSFRIVKFRTMVDGAEEVLKSDPDLHKLHMQNDFKLPVDLDPRVTGVGRFLRRTSLDELPQLFNVLRGDMSLVGARPIEPAQVHRLYGQHTDAYHHMRPGLTGFWQVNGRSEVSQQDRAEMDVYYLQNWSLWLDLRIMLKTLPVVIRKHGAH
jgi:exopolysaccharide biosynthesis polyprenyl glycosylphosphotransferase